MTSAHEKAALVALLRGGEQPWSAYADLVEEAGSATAVLKDTRPAQESLFGEGIRDGRAAGDPGPATGADAGAEDLDARIAAAAADIASWEAEGIRLLTVLDPDYPENLRAVHDRPPLIFVTGALEQRDARSVAVVGARNATERGLSAARGVAAHLVEHSYTVFSGLAAGIDTAAHTAALARDGRTVAVIGTGLRRTYPPQNAALQRRLAGQSAVISQFWPDAPPSRRSFPMRNAVMSGLTLATVVVEASHSSGSRLQARLALAHGRPVFLIESLLEQPWAREFAARPGTHVVRSPAQITETVERLTSSGALVA